MPQSLHQVYSHIVFSTKDRAPNITGDIEKQLYAYMGGIIRDLKAEPVIINGMPDHVHVLIRSSKHVADTDFMRQLKGSSSKWMNQQRDEKFQWQAGYGWFGVSAKDLPAAKKYIKNQKQHHNSTPFKDEFRAFLNKYEISYDERYVWD